MSSVPDIAQELQQLQSFAKLFHTVFWGARLNAFQKHPGAIHPFAEQWPPAPDVVECLKCLLEDHKNASLLKARLCELLLAGGAGDLVVELIRVRAVLPNQIFRYQNGVEFSLLHLACVTGAVEVGRYFKHKESSNLWNVQDSEGKPFYIITNSTRTHTNATYNYGHILRVVVWHSVCLHIMIRPFLLVAKCSLIASAPMACRAYIR